MMVETENKITLIWGEMPDFIRLHLCSEIELDLFSF